MVWGSSSCFPTSNSSPSYCLDCLGPPPSGTIFPAYTSLGTAGSNFAPLGSFTASHGPVYILPFYSFCGHSDTNQILWQRGEAPCTCRFVPAFSQARPGFPENKRVPKLDHQDKNIRKPGVRRLCPGNFKLVVSKLFFLAKHFLSSRNDLK